MCFAWTKKSGPVLKDRFGDRLQLTAIADLEKARPELAACKANRSPWEYCLTCRCHFIEFLLESGLESVVCLDGDFYFFGKLESAFDGRAEVVITPHRFPQALEPLLRYGKFNAGFTAFKKGEVSRNVLRKWCVDCLEFCDSVGDGERYTDQKYLDAWEGLPGVEALENPAINAAPWNIGKHSVTMVDDRPVIEKSPLLLFHFHGLREFYPSCWVSGVGGYGNQMTETLMEGVYLPYLRHVVAVRQGLGGGPVPEPLVLPMKLPANAPRTQRVSMEFAATYEKSLRLLHEKEATIHELQSACEERLKKVIQTRAMLSRVELTSIEYWLRRLFRRPMK